MGIDCVTRSHIGCRRKLNEDAVLARTDLKLWAVADGMGGHEAGDVASKMVVEALDAIMPDTDLIGRVAAARGALKGANQALQSLGSAEASVTRMIGSTVVVLMADDRAFSCIWAGDSRAYLLRDGRLAQLTRDHSVVQKLIDAGMLTEGEADQHPHRNVVTRAVGAAETLDLDLARGDFLKGDIFLLASDGLTRLVDERELLTGLETADLDQAADRFVDMVLDRGAPDNLSFVMIRVS